jgi:hypothetical protein
MKKTMLLAVGAVGYVLGAKAGRERYEQIMSGASKIARDPRVQQKTHEAADAVRHNAPMVKDKVAGAASSAKDTVKQKTSGGTTPEPGPITGADPSTTTPYPEA